MVPFQSFERMNWTPEYHSLMLCRWKSHGTDFDFWPIFDFSTTSSLMFSMCSDFIHTWNLFENIKTRHVHLGLFMIHDITWKHHSWIWNLIKKVKMHHVLWINDEFCNLLTPKSNLKKSINQSCSIPIAPASWADRPSGAEKGLGQVNVAHFVYRQPNLNRISYIWLLWL